MRKSDGTIDWDRTEEHARGMTNVEIHYALLDIQKTLPNADALDREDGGCRGGYYRDEASVLRRVREERL
jgi:hypothetical protein